jgi:two-component sensor histidine kinase
VTAPGTNAGSIVIKGQPVTCGEHARNGIALIVHELATNAVKYGALTNIDGQVSIEWKADETSLELTWKESGGPAVCPPTTLGFGSTLIQRIVTGQFRGSMKQEWSAPGLVATMKLTLAKLAL